MNAKNTRGYMSDVDQLIERTSLDSVLSHYGLPMSQNGAREHRMKCVFNEACSDSKYGNLAVSLDVAKQIYCHTCNVRGNLLTLIHGLETHQPPDGGRLRGQEFKAAVAKLREINGIASSPAISKSMSSSAATTESSTATTSLGTASNTSSESAKPVMLSNISLHRHDKEAARELADLWKDLETNIANMSPEAAAYVRKRAQWLTPELMQKWGCGWIPGNGRSLFRKNYFVYTHRNTRGDIVSYSGRDLTFEKKWDAWVKAGKPEGKKPNKHRYVSGFHRGAELYGGFASRLQEPHIQESLEKHGLVVVEGMNDVIRLDELSICAVGLCSNRATEQQVDMLQKFAQKVANGRLTLFPDADQEGETGFKDLLWNLSSSSVQVTIAQQFKSVSQPEDLSVWYQSSFEHRT